MTRMLRKCSIYQTANSRSIPGIQSSANSRSIPGIQSSANSRSIPGVQSSANYNDWIGWIDLLVL